MRFALVEPNGTVMMVNGVADVTGRVSGVRSAPGEATDWASVWFIVTGDCLSRLCGGCVAW